MSPWCSNLWSFKGERRNIVVSFTFLAVLSLLYSCISIWFYFELLRHGNCELLVSFSRKGSVSGPNVWDSSLFIGYLCETTSLLSFKSGIWGIWEVSKVGSLIKLVSFAFARKSANIATRKPLGIVGGTVLKFSGLSIAAIEWKAWNSNLKVG